MTTAFNIIKRAMQKAGILTKAESPAADEAADALSELNNLLQSWSNESMLIYARTWEIFNTTGGVGTYTIGPSQAFNTVRPMVIIAATINNGGIESPLEIISDEDYVNNISLKNQQGIPQYINYDNAFPVGNIKLWPVPATNYPLRLLTEKQLTSFTLYQDVELPIGWEDALIYNLAVRLAPEYGTEPSALVVEQANNSKGAIQRTITKNRTMDADTAGLYYGNIWNGWQI